MATRYPIGEVLADISYNCQDTNTAYIAASAS